MDSQNVPVTDTDHWVPLVDVSGLSLAELRGDTGEDTALRRSVRRLIEGLDDPHGVISAFGSFVSDE